MSLKRLFAATLIFATITSFSLTGKAQDDDGHPEDPGKIEDLPKTDHKPSAAAGSTMQLNGGKAVRAPNSSAPTGGSDEGLPYSDEENQQDQAPRYQKNTGNMPVDQD